MTASFMPADLPPNKPAVPEADAASFLTESNWLLISFWKIGQSCSFKPIRWDSISDTGHSSSRMRDW